MTRRLQVLLSVAVLALASGPVLAQEGDPAAGKQVFNQCRACHVPDEQRNKVGPSLLGVFGRPAGTVEGFKYSSAMKESGIVWNEETIAAYVADPASYVPGNRMFFRGVQEQEDIADLVAYLKEATATQ